MKPIVVEQTFAVDRERLWQAITDPDEMRQWYFESIPDFRAVVGFETLFDVDTGGRVFGHRWTVTDVEEGGRLVYEWRYDGYPGLGRTEWELAEAPDGTRLRLTSTGTETFPQDVPEFRRESGVRGWRYFLQESLPSFLGHG